METTGEFTSGGQAGSGQESQGALGSAREQAGEKAALARQQVGEQAGRVKEQAGSRLRSEVDRRSTQAGEQAGQVADALRTSAQQMRDRGQEQPARLVEGLAGRTDGIASYLRDSDGERILGDAEDYARRHPWLVGAAAMVGGFAASRLVKASAQRRADERGPVRGQAPRAASTGWSSAEAGGSGPLAGVAGDPGA
ncbi:MAG: hypothetical protein R3C15_00015 [Thermoleophilia bacterium]